ncbi:hypothetical protein [Arthrobacter sp. MDT1-65]
MVIQDAGGNPTTSTAPVTLSLTNAAGAILTCAPNPKPAVSGTAAFAGCRIDRPGTYTLTATSGTLTTAVSTTITIAS